MLPGQKSDYFERSRLTGRLGPVVCELDLTSAYGQYTVYQDSLQMSVKCEGEIEGPILDIEAKSRWMSVRANTCIFGGCFYYEVQLHTDGVMQIGWCTYTTPFNGTDGVGDS